MIPSLARVPRQEKHRHVPSGRELALKIMQVLKMGCSCLSSTQNHWGFQMFSNSIVCLNFGMVYATNMGIKSNFIKLFGFK